MHIVYLSSRNVFYTMCVRTTEVKIWSNPPRFDIMIIVETSYYISADPQVEESGRAITICVLDARLTYLPKSLLLSEE